LSPFDEFLEVDVARLGNGVGGIAPREDGRTVFVRGALPGERVRCIVSRTGRRHLEAKLSEVLSPSPHRIQPFCPAYPECGGCSLQHLAYDRQLYWKRRWIARALDRAGLDGIDVPPVMASPLLRGYRNRVSFDIVDGCPGLHRYRGDPFAVEDCPLLNPRGREVLGKLLGVDLSSFSRLTVRASFNTPDTMVELRGKPLELPPEVVGGVTCAAVQSEGRWTNRGARMTEILAGFRFPVPPGCFFQVNTKAAEILVDLVVDMAEGTGPVLDLYGGMGCFGFSLAQRNRKVHVVERSSSAIDAGREAAETSGVDGMSFESDYARRFLARALAQGRRFETVIVDPPRSGLGKRVARLLAKLSPQGIVYVSCNPFAMARDVKILRDSGYTLEEVQPLDLFPHTDHVECVIRLSGGTRTEER
jgi:23S rRNA (uracil1939-C5)-methyltransferase